MSVTQFELVSHWRIAAPLQRVWPEIVDVDDWPSWWRAVRKVERLQDGDAGGIGALRRITWATALPYTITFDVVSTRIEPMHLIQWRTQRCRTLDPQLRRRRDHRALRLARRPGQTLDANPGAAAASRLCLEP
ncbi:MAG TPA: SRPBCC family protein [Devosia sp.]|jgi:uncharacterized protein YndB with AHSA1/START domain|uniref:SRPBCC family protein n=1 Tax=Devosia sp. TaxID=1871048 RepID=UPI002DDD596F|nr:SRPBCC family protein [Devosia sp.]HEV2514093.1 SRPBCC family protein [Devosia sp.]